MGWGEFYHGWGVVVSGISAIRCQGASIHAMTSERGLSRMTSETILL